jgi:hypothetical protein
MKILGVLLIPVFVIAVMAASVAVRQPEHGRHYE